MLGQFIKKLFGDGGDREVRGLLPIVEQINALRPEMEALTDEGLRNLTAGFREELNKATQEDRDRLRELQEELDHEQDETERGALRQQVEAQRKTLGKREQAILDEVLPRAFAAVREAARRTIGQVHFDEQLIGGMVLHQGKVAEMKTGEGKTLVATLPLYLNALTGRGVHLVTPNDYLSQVGGGWMGPVYHKLGLSVGLIMHEFAGIYDPDYVDPGDHGGDSRLVHWRPCERRDAYRADITYGTNNEFGFDYLRDNMVQDLSQCVQRELNYAVVDEVDNILIDEARTPLIISGEAEESTSQYQRFAQIARTLRPETDYTVEEKLRVATLTDEGINKVERALRIDNLYAPENYELTPYLENALKAEVLFHRDHDYVVQDGQVIIVDEFTGRLMHGRRYSEGLHQAIEAKEGVMVRRESLTWATITFQNYFRMYQKLAGMTGTAETEKEELYSIYGLDVVVIPTHVPMQRIDHPDVVYKTTEAKFDAVLDEIAAMHNLGRPVLVGTAAVETSEMLSGKLKKRGVPHNVLNAKQHEKEALVIAQAGRPGTVTIATNMAGRGVDILLGGNPEGLVAYLLESRFSSAAKSFVQAVLDGDLERARQLAQRTQGLTEASIDKVRQLRSDREQYGELREKNDQHRYIVDKLVEEGQIQQGAQRLVALDLARAVLEERWNLANFLTSGSQNVPEALADEVSPELERHLKRLYAEGRGLPEDLVVEIKRLCGDYELDDIEFITRQLFAEYYNAMITVIHLVLGGERQRAEAYIREHPAFSQDAISEIEKIMENWRQDRQKVKDLGGLHIIGTERHEARRIDNQLRGRAGRQGDPGSSRFYISLEDDLMRRFGGPAVANLMDRLGVDANIPIEHNMVSRVIASSQMRVEGYNFDLRKHILEYDDVVNQQRRVIYDQRRLILAEQNLKPIALDILHEVVAGTVEAMTQGEPEEWDLKTLYTTVDRMIHLGNESLPNAWANMSAEQIQEQLAGLIETNYDRHEQQLGAELMRRIERTAMLSSIDRRWVRHLTALDELREGIGLRAFGQRNPLVEYKREAFDSFENLLSDIKTDVANMVMNIYPVTQAQMPAARRPARYAGATGGAAGSLRPKGQAASPQREVGRNDPCPCGSGKKYKNCCLREGLTPEQAAAKKRAGAAAGKPAAERQPNSSGNTPRRK